MPDYFVTVDHEEVNETANACSITGTVNGVQCAALVKCSDLNGKEAKDQERIKMRALARTFAGRQAVPPSQAGAVKVSL